MHGSIFVSLKHVRAANASAERKVLVAGIQYISCNQSRHKNNSKPEALNCFVVWERAMHGRF